MSYSSTKSPGKYTALMVISLANGINAINSDMTRQNRINYPSCYSSTNPENIKKNALRLVQIHRNNEILNGFRNLQPNWNTYGAEPISPTIIDNTIELLSNLSVQPQIFPTGRNSVQLEYQNENDYLEFEIYENSIEYFQRKNGVSVDGEITQDRINTIIQNFNA